MERSAAISEFGVVCGMTMPMLSLPIVFLGALNLVLVPRLARACALNLPGEVRRLSSRAMAAVSVLTLPAMALMVVLGPDLGRLMFKPTVASPNPENPPALALAIEQADASGADIVIATDPDVYKRQPP